MHAIIAGKAVCSEVFAPLIRAFGLGESITKIIVANILIIAITIISSIKVKAL